MKSFRLCRLQHFKEKFALIERFASREGYAAAGGLVEGLVLHDFFYDLFYRRISAEGFEAIEIALFRTFTASNAVCTVEYVLSIHYFVMLADGGTSATAYALFYSVGYRSLTGLGLGIMAP